MWFRVIKRRVRRVVRRGRLAGTKLHYQEHRTTAQAFVSKRLKELNQPYGFTYHRVTIKNQATRWGSCSKHGNLNFHYKIALLPAELADYVLVHELCHLKELNHSKQFWALVAQTVPHYKLLRRRLKTATLQP